MLIWGFVFPIIINESTLIVASLIVIHGLLRETPTEMFRDVRLPLMDVKLCLLFLSLSIQRNSKEYISHHSPYSYLTAIRVWCNCQLGPQGTWYASTTKSTGSWLIEMPWALQSPSLLILSRNSAPSSSPGVQSN